MRVNSKLVLIVTIACALSFGKAYAEQGGKPAPNSTSNSASGQLPLAKHIEGIGGRGSFQLFAERDGCDTLIASIETVSGRRTVFIDEVQLHRGAANAMKKARLRTYAALKAAVVETLVTLSQNGTPSDLQWPIKCVFVCPVHHSCERYKWIGFFSD